MSALADTAKPVVPEKFDIVEGIGGTWFYHLAETGKKSTALCGRPTMSSEMTRAAWGYRSAHIGERYCENCERKAGMRE